MPAAHSEKHKWLQQRVGKVLGLKGKSPGVNAANFT
jgi:hypothetical protein